MNLIGTNYKDEFYKGKYGIISHNRDYILVAKNIFYNELEISIKKNIKSVEIVTDQNKKNFVGAVGWAFVGGVALGGIGALAGLLAGGNKKQLVFNMTLKDGSQIMASGTPKEYQRVMNWAEKNNA